MSDNKLVKTIMDAGLAAGIGWVVKKMAKETLPTDPCSNVLNYAKFTAVRASSIALKQYRDDSPHKLKSKLIDISTLFFEWPALR